MNNKLILSRDLKPLSYLCAHALRHQRKVTGAQPAKLSNFKVLDEAANAFGYSGYSDMLFKEKTKGSGVVSYLLTSALHTLGKHFAQHYGVSSRELIATLNYLIAFHEAASQSFSVMYSSLSAEGKSVFRDMQKRSRKNQDGTYTATFKSKLPLSIIEETVTSLYRVKIELKKGAVEASKSAFVEASLSNSNHAVKVLLKSNLRSPELEVVGDIFASIGKSSVQ